MPKGKLEGGGGGREEEEEKEEGKEEGQGEIECLNSINVIENDTNNAR